MFILIKDRLVIYSQFSYVTFVFMKENFYIEYPVQFINTENN